MEDEVDVWHYAILSCVPETTTTNVLWKQGTVKIMKVEVLLHEEAGALLADLEVKQEKICSIVNQHPGKYGFVVTDSSV